MPIREFHCEACNHEWEKLNPKDEKCPKCGSDCIRQKFSRCSWMFRGVFELFGEGDA